MMRLLVRLCINSLSLIIMTLIVPGLHLASLSAAVLTALVWGMINTLVRPIFSFFTFPLQLLTLGLFTLFINGTMLALTAKLVPSFTIQSFSSAFIGALVLSVISLVLTQIFK